MILTLAATGLVAYFPGALLFRLPWWDRSRRARLAIEERVFWHVFLSLAWSLSVVLALAALEQYRFERLLWVNASAGVALALAARSRLRYRGEAVIPSWSAVLPLALVALSLWRFFPVSEYIIGGKDPGVYINEGIQIAQRGTLVIHDPVVAAVPDDARDLFFPYRYQEEYYSNRFMGFFLQEPRGGRVIGQFPHLFPASIAIGYGLHGLSGAREAVAWWAVLGVLAVYFAGARLIGPAAAFAASALLTLHVIQVWFARYPNTDVVMQAMVFAALLAFARAHQDHDGFFAPVAAVIAGLMIFLRVESALAIVALVAAALLVFVAIPRSRLRAGFLVPLALIGALGWLYLSGPMQAYLWRPMIYLTHLPAMGVVAGATAAFAVLVALLWMRRRHAERSQRVVPWVVAGVVVLLAGYAWFFRTPGGPLRAMDAYALRNFVDLYLWWPAALAALIGFVLVTRRDFWRDPGLVLTVAAFSIFTFYKLNIVHEHFWMARRFVAVILPAALLFAASAAIGRGAGSWRGWPAARQAIGLVLVSALALRYSVATAPLLPHVEYRGVIPYLERLAGTFGERDLVLVESRNSESDVHVFALPLAYIYAKTVLVLDAAAPDLNRFRLFLDDALTRYDRVLFLGGGGTLLLSRQIGATPIASDRKQVDEYEVTTDTLPAAIRQKEFDYGIYQLRIGATGGGPFSLDIGDRDDLHVVRLHAKEQSEGRSIRWTQDASVVAITGLNGSERELMLVMSDGGRPATAPAAIVDVFLNDEAIGRAKVGPGFQPYRFAIPEALVTRAAKDDAPARLRLVSTVWSPFTWLSLPDRRDLGVMLDSVSVR